MLWLVALQAIGSSDGEIPAAPGLLHIEEAAQRATEIKEGMEVELTSRVSCAGAHALVYSNQNFAAVPFAAPLLGRNKPEGLAFTLYSTSLDR